MNYLIDTHVCLWSISSKEELSAKAKSILENKDVKIFVSQVSFFEIAIKLNIGKLLEFNITLPQFLASVYSTGFEVLPFKDEHLVAYSFLIFQQNIGILSTAI